MKQLLIPTLLATACALAFAKLPPLDDAAKAKAAETAAKAAWQAKLDNYQLCKAQDKVAAKFRGKGSAAPTATPAVAKPAAPASAAAAPASPAAPIAAATPAAAAPPAPCADPGVFAYNAPEQKPLETSGAHSPTGTAASPPSVKQDSAQMAPAQAKK